jgi:hypothetical protein
MEPNSYIAPRLIEVATCNRSGSSFLLSLVQDPGVPFFEICHKIIRFINPSFPEISYLNREDYSLL